MPLKILVCEHRWPFSEHSASLAVFRLCCIIFVLFVIWNKNMMMTTHDTLQQPTKLVTKYAEIVNISLQ